MDGGGSVVPGVATRIDPGPLAWAQVLQEEEAAAGGEGEARRRWGLCLSGGGIRAAMLGLGLLQGLAERDGQGGSWLERFDYLSTASGGGYIGAWLAAWMHREGRERVLSDLRPEAGGGEPQEVARLRAMCDYLTPRMGVLAGDTWTLIATVIRNLLWNWAVFVPLVLAAVLAPQAAWGVAAHGWGVSVTAFTWVPAAVLAGLFGVLAPLGLWTRARERNARRGGQLLRAAAVWSVLCGLTLLAPAWLLTLHGSAVRHGVVAAATAIAAISGWLAALAGSRSSATRARPAPAAGGGEALLVRLGPALFVAGMMVGLGAILRAQVPLTMTAPTLAALVLLAVAAARCVNVNTCSLQGMYRDRLTRAFLGGADVPLSQLAGQRPLLVMNMTLNLTRHPRLPWQQRRAALFTATPLHCGSAVTGWRPTSGYAGGLGLGAAMATSGAAVNPNMGSHSAPCVAFLMALFNLRLGAWLGNPAQRRWRRSAPRSSLLWLAREGLGWAGDRSPYVNLSDGGHFENLGLYALVQRRCRIIVALDAGCDPAFEFADLGNAVEKIRVDLGIAIDFEAGGYEALRAQHRRWARAPIRYSMADGAGASDGELIYLKPMVQGDEAADVLSYAHAHAAFPHESTLEQWFSETQMESYRMLGLETARSVVASVTVGAP